MFEVLTKEKINPFVDLPESLEESFDSFGLDNDEKKYLYDKFRSQYPEIDETSYLILKKIDSQITRNFGAFHGDNFKNESELSELVNHSFFSIILEDIVRNNPEISNFKIYNSYGYTDKKAGVDYTVFLKLANGESIAFGLDLKNGRNVEDNYNELFSGTFNLISNKSNGEAESYDGIMENIDRGYSISKSKNKYTIGINPRNQNAINDIFFDKLFKSNFEDSIKSLNIFNYIKSYFGKIINKELDFHNKSIVGETNQVITQVEDLLKLTKKQEEIKKLQREEEERKQRLLRINQKEKKRQKEEVEKSKKASSKDKDKTRVNYTRSIFLDDFQKMLEETDNPSNLTNFMETLILNKTALKEFKEILTTLKFIGTSGTIDKFSYSYTTRSGRTTIIINKVKKNKIIRRYNALYEGDMIEKIIFNFNTKELSKYSKDDFLNNFQETLEEKGYAGKYNELLYRLIVDKSLRKEFLRILNSLSKADDKINSSRYSITFAKNNTMYISKVQRNRIIKLYNYLLDKSLVEDIKLDLS